MQKIKVKVSLGLFIISIILFLCAISFYPLQKEIAYADSFMFNPLVAYDFSNSANYGKDKMGRIDLVKYNQSATTNKIDEGIMTMNNTFYLLNENAMKDLSDYFTTFSLSLWFKPLATGTSRIVTNGNYAIPDGFALIYEKTADGKGFIYPDMYSTQGINGETGTSGHFTYRTEVGDLNAWHKFAMSIDSTAKRVVYVLDDTVIGDFTYEGELRMCNEQQSFSLFGLTHTAGGGNVDYFNGALADVRIYDFALNATQLKTIQLGKELTSDYTTEYLASVQEFDELNMNNSVPINIVLNSLPKKVTLTGSKSSTIESDVEWVRINKNGSEGKAYGYIISKALPNIKGLMAEIDISFSENVELPLILSPMFQDNMILQRNGCRIFGKAGITTVTVAVEGYDPVTVESQNGEWEVEINLQASATPKTVTISTGKGETRTLNNVLVGEVWYASGQSNMDYNVQQMTAYTLDKLKNADYSNLRMMKRSMYGAFTPVERWCDVWKAPSGYDDVKEQSAFATCYALALSERLEILEGKKIPVGIVSAAIGGSGIEQWMSKESIEITGSRIDTGAGKYDTHYYYGMSYSVKNFSFRGALWYQGEDNVYYPELYKKQFKYYLKDIRELFNDENLPLLVVQLPQFNMIEWAQFREIQWELSQENNNVYTVVGLEFGEIDDIHPTKDKYQFAERASEIAMNKIYGDESAAGLSPYPKNSYIEGESLIVELSDNKGLHTLYGRMADGFELYINGKWIESTPTVINDQLIFNNFEGTPSMIRYFYLANTSKYEAGFNYIYNERNMPLSPFIVNVGEKQFSVNISAGNGKINVDNSLFVKKGTVVSFIVTVPNNFEIDKVMQNGVSIYFNGNTVNSSAIMQDTEIVVTYKKKTIAKKYSITVDNDDNKGTVKLSKDSVTSGESSILIVTAKKGYQLLNITLNGNVIFVEDDTLVLNNVSSDVNVKVNYVQSEQVEENSGCNSSLGGMPIGFIIVALLGLIVVSHKIKIYGGKND